MSILGLRKVQSKISQLPVPCVSVGAPVNLQVCLSLGSGSEMRRKRSEQALAFEYQSVDEVECWEKGG